MGSSSTAIKKITITNFVQNLETFAIDFFKSCLHKTNQYSTIYVLQRLIKENQKHQRTLQPVIKTLGIDQISLQYLVSLRDNFTKKRIESKFELDCLNFVEATNITIIVTEFLLSEYQKLIGNASISSESKTALEQICQYKEKYLQLLRSENEKLRYK